MKTYKVLPKVNNLKFAGRLMADPVVTKTRIAFTVIHNMGGDKPAVFRDFILFAEKVPECLKKGAPVVVNARLAADVYTNAEGKKVTRLQFIVKNVEKANVVNGVVVAGVVISRTGWAVIDPAISLVIAAVILFNTLKLLADAFRSLRG